MRGEAQAARVPGDVYVRAADKPWMPFGPGLEMKLLRASQETGHWTVLLKGEAGSALAPHRHLGAGEYFVIRGHMEVRGGAARGGITAKTGDYGYEPNGIVHDSTRFIEETVLYFTNHGPVAALDENGNTVAVLDWQAIEQIAAGVPFG